MWPFTRGNRATEPPHLRTGRWGEKQAERILKQKGYRILDRRVRVGRRDELDLVARMAETLVFVEVKTRRDERFGRAVKAVRRAKQKAMGRAAIRYIRRMKQPPPYIRFDVIEVIGSEEQADPIIRHIENAFPLPRPYRIRW